LNALNVVMMQEIQQLKNKMNDVEAEVAAANEELDAETVPYKKYATMLY